MPCKIDPTVYLECLQMKEYPSLFFIIKPPPEGLLHSLILQRGTRSKVTVLISKQH